MCALPKVIRGFPEEARFRYESEINNLSHLKTDNLPPEFQIFRCHEGDFISIEIKSVKTNEVTDLVQLFEFEKVALLRMRSEDRQSKKNLEQVKIELFYECPASDQRKSIYKKIISDQRKSEHCQLTISSYTPTYVMEEFEVDLTIAILLKEPVKAKSVKVLFWSSSVRTGDKIQANELPLIKQTVIFVKLPKIFNNLDCEKVFFCVQSNDLKSETKELMYIPHSIKKRKARHMAEDSDVSLNKRLCSMGISSSSQSHVSGFVPQPGVYACDELLKSQAELTSLIDAIGRDHEERLKSTALRDAGAFVHSLAFQCVPPVQYQILKNILLAVPHLVGSLDEMCDTPLNNAILMNNQPICQLFMDTMQELQFNFNLKNSDGHTPLILMACAILPAEMMQQLLLCGADANLCDDFSRNPLHYAVLHNNEQMVQLLLANGANYQSCDIMNESALTYAIKLDQVEVLELILKKHIELGQNLDLCLIHAQPSESCMRVLESYGIPLKVDFPQDIEDLPKDLEDLPMAQLEEFHDVVSTDITVSWEDSLLPSQN